MVMSSRSTKKSLLRGVLRLPRLSVAVCRLALGGLTLAAQAATVRYELSPPLRRELIESLMADRVELAAQQSANLPLAADLAFMLEELLREQGYPQARVTGRVDGADIQLSIDAGTRVLLGEVHGLGPLSAREIRRLREIFITPSLAKRLPLQREIPWDPVAIEAGRIAVEQDLQAQGYWQARVAVTSAPASHAEQPIDVQMQIERGALHMLTAPQWLTPLPQALQELQRELDRAAPLTATSSHINQLRVRIRQHCLERGYSEVSLRLSPLLGANTFTPQISLELGLPYTLRTVKVCGSNATTQSRVLRLFAPRLQRLYDQSLIDQRLHQLLATGAFRSARYETSRHASSQQLDLTLHLQDGKARGISGYGGMETYEGAILGARYHDDNLAQSLRGLSAGLEWTARGALFDVLCSDPWLFDREIRGQLRYNAITRDLDGYQKFETGLLGSATWDLAPAQQLTLLLSSAQVHTSETELQRRDLGETAYNHLRARLSWLHDRRDQSSLPENGWYVESACELGSAVSNLPTAYIKTEFSSAWYRRWQDSGKLALGWRSGWLTPATRGADLPIDIRYFLGGAQSFRGLDERQLGPRNSSSQPRGGNAYWLVNAEWTQPLSSPVEAALFVDTGTLARRSMDFDADDVSVTLGCGLHWRLPIGPLRLEYGRNLTRRDNEPHGAFHFAIGVAF